MVVKNLKRKKRISFITLTITLFYLYIYRERESNAINLLRVIPNVIKLLKLLLNLRYNLLTFDLLVILKVILYLG